MKFRTLILLSVTVSAITLQVNADEKLSAVGIGVKDLDASTRFYQHILGLDVLRTYELGYINEIVLGYKDSESAVLVLMNWPGQDRVYDGDNTKIVFNVKDPAGVIERIREHGRAIDREALPIEALDGTIVGLGRDLDNYVVEVIQR